MPDVQRIYDSLSDLNGEPADIGAEDTSHRGQANGYAALDAYGNIDPSQMAIELDLVDDEI